MHHCVVLYSVLCVQNSEFGILGIFCTPCLESPVFPWICDGNDVYILVGEW
jgi:hypothetical protein